MDATPPTSAEREATGSVSPGCVVGFDMDEMTKL
jgi:hypothetical protein